MDIILTTINAKYAHASFALRYLRANLGELRARSEVVEFTHQTKPVDMVERLLSHGPKVVGFSVYVWNVEALTRVVETLKTVRPDVQVVVGGPEVSHEWDKQRIVELADVVVTGEGEGVFASLCRQLLEGQKVAQKIVAGGLPDVAHLVLPYEEYTPTDIADRIVYVEASRGCPFRCEFCLSSLDARVRNFPLDALLQAFQDLFDRGVRRFKFIDRTFNLKISHSVRILRFFRDLYEPGLFVHFEMIPDRLPEELREVIASFPAGALQFEVGVQTLDEDVSARISRRQDVQKLAQNLRFLREHTGVHVHTDLIVGLPGEDMASFGRGMDQLFSYGAQEIQVGILKRLRGTPIARHSEEHGMVYASQPPYEVLQTHAIDFPTMQRLKRFAHVWDRTVNRGHFVATAPLIWGDNSPFAPFLTWSDWLYQEHGQVHALSLAKLTGYLSRYLVEVADRDRDAVTIALDQDARSRAVSRTGLERQYRHIAGRATPAG